MSLQINLQLTKSPIEQLNSDVLIVFATKALSNKTTTKSSSKKNAGEKLAPTSVLGLGKALNTDMQNFLKDNQDLISGSAQEFTFFRNAAFSGFRHLAIVGLGDPSKITAETVRQAAATAVTNLKSIKIRTMTFAFDSVPRSAGQTEAFLQAAAEGAGLAFYSFDELKMTSKNASTIETIQFTSSSSGKSLESAVQKATTIVDCVSFSRRLGDTPANRMTPKILADEVTKAAKGTKLKVTVWDLARIKKEKMNSFISVSLGSSQEPRFIIMEYKGAAASKKPVCFVGKGVTFDSGGISIKPSSGMEEMKFDMCGGANVIGTMLAIAKLGLKVNVMGFVPATENMPGPSANKPGDIVVARNGKSIEVNNTDAEGRLILNDALAYACEQGPAAVFDAATLTGAMVIALGNIYTGFFTRNDKLAEKVNKAAEISGELVWHMPLNDFHSQDMKGTYADLSNMSSTRGAGSATAAAFLENFVEDDVLWAHFDIAGTGWHNGNRFPYNPKKGASGAMIRTFIELAQMF